MCTPLVQGTTDLLHSELRGGGGEHAQILPDRPKTSKDPDRQEMLLKYASNEYICPVIDCARPPAPHFICGSPNSQWDGISRWSLMEVIRVP